MRRRLKIIGGFVIAGLLAGLIDAIFDTHFFYHDSFIDQAFSNVPGFEIYFRSLLLIIFIGFGLIFSKLFIKNESVSLNLNKFKLGIELSEEVVFMTDPEGKIIYVNPAFTKEYGYSKEETIGKTPRILKSNTLPGDVYKQFWDTLKTGKNVVGEIVNKTKDGRLLNIDGSASPIISKENKIIGFLAIQRDITARKLAEELLKEKDNQYRLIVESSHDLIWVLNFEGNFIYINPAAEKLAGFPVSNLFGKSFNPLIKAEDLPRVKDIFLATLSGKAQSYDVRVLVKEGEEVCLAVNTAPLYHQDKVIGTISFARDITKDKSQQEIEKQNYENMKRVLEEITVSLSSALEKRDPYTAGHQQRVTQLAAAIARNMGIEDDTITGLRIAGILHDIGKIAVPSEILSKPGKLTELEFSMIKTHAQVGYDILQGIEFPWPVAQIVLQHHERMNGSGYPQGVMGEKMLLEARILAVADVVEAMASHRPYRPARGIAAALEEITQNKRKLYDPAVVDSCLKVFKENSFTFSD